MIESEPILDQTRIPEDRNLVVRSEQTNLDQMAGSPMLAIFGFSPQFVERLAELNDVLKTATLPARALDITLYPGQTPIVQTYLEPYRGYFVNLRAYRDHQVSFIVEYPSQPGGPIGQGFRLQDIQNFLESAFPSRKTHLFVSRNLWRIDAAAKEDLDQDIFAVTEDALKPITKQIITPNPETGNKQIIGRAYDYNGEIRLAGQKEPLMVVRFWDRFPLNAQDEEDKTVIIHLEKFFYSGNTDEVEKVIDEVTRLFNKPEGYPYRRVDRNPQAEQEEE